MAIVTRKINPQSWCNVVKFIPDLMYGVLEKKVAIITSLLISTKILNPSLPNWWTHALQPRFSFWTLFCKDVHDSLAYLQWVSIHDILSEETGHCYKIHYLCWFSIYHKTQIKMVRGLNSKLLGTLYVDAPLPNILFAPFLVGKTCFSFICEALY